MTTADYTPTIHVRGNVARGLKRIQVDAFGFRVRTRVRPLGRSWLGGRSRGWPAVIRAHDLRTESPGSFRRPSKRAPTTCLESRRASVGDQGRRAARIVNQDVLVRKALRAMFSRLRRSESKPLGVH
jgi:hypothetical protein